MPVRKTYKGRPVVRMKRGPRPGSITLTFANARPGDRKERLVVTQQDWARHGSESYTPGQGGPDDRRPSRQR